MALHQAPSADQHTSAHDHDHQTWSRRQFLAMSGIATLGASLLFHKIPIRAAAPSPLLAALSNASTDRCLVLIRLKGGNDGLNTVIPLDQYSSYQTARPTLAISNANTIALADGSLGINNALSDIHPLWLDGKMKIVRNTGYPSQNLSHFRSSDIWATASNTADVWYTGWAGRYFDREYPAYFTASPSVPPALQIGSDSNLMFRGGAGNMALVLNSVTDFYNIAQTGNLYDANDIPPCYYGEELSFMRTITNSSVRFSDVVKAAYDSSSNSVSYPTTNNRLAEQLAVIARLIKGNLGTKIYMVTLDGFDTHSAQLTTHNTLLTRLAQSVKAFTDDLTIGGKSQDVLIMTFSEFGRRIAQNGSAGTDHGEGSPLFLWGDELNGGGIVGNAPNITTPPTTGNVTFETDFRSIYATILQDWFCLDPLLTDAIMGSSQQRISNLFNACQPSTDAGDWAVLLGHQPDLEQSGHIMLKYAVLNKGNVRLQILNTAGRAVVTLFNEFRETGSYIYDFVPAAYRLPAGEYIYQIEASGKQYSRLIRIGF